MYQTHFRERGHISSFYHIFEYVDVYFNLIAQSSPLMSVNKWRSVCLLLSFLYSLFCILAVFKMSLDWFLPQGARHLTQSLDTMMISPSLNVTDHMMS